MNDRTELGRILESSRAAELDDILSRWHSWARGEQHARGFGNTALGMGDWRSSRQHDSDNGALDDDLEKSTMRVVDFQVSELRDPYRAAIHMNARNIFAGRIVFRSPRMPQNLEEAAAILRLARGMLTERLTNAGVM